MEPLLKPVVPDDCADLFGDSSDLFPPADLADLPNPTNQPDSPKRTWGGARPGAGRKPAGYVRPRTADDLDDARARHEDIKADRAELAFQKELGEWVSRAAYREAMVRIVAAFTQTVRSIPDNLERELAIEGAVAEKVGLYLDNALDKLADKLEKLVDGDVDA